MRPGQMLASSCRHAGLPRATYYLPSSMSVDALAVATSMPERRRALYTGAHGLRVVHIATQESAAEMATLAVKSALEKENIDPLEVDALILYHTMNFLSLEPRTFVGELQQRLGLKNAHSLSISGQHCASPLTALRVARNMIVAQSAETVMLVGCDSFLGSLRREIVNVSLQGEGASCAIVQANCERNRVLAVLTFVDGSLYRGIVALEAEQNKFDLIYFLASHRLIRRTLDKLSLTIDDIALIIPHNINRSSWSRILAGLKCSEDKLFADNIERCGHVCSSDLLINLSDVMESGRLTPGDYFMLFTVGLGAVWACAILQY